MTDNVTFTIKGVGESGEQPQPIDSNMLYLLFGSVVAVLVVIAAFALRRRSQ